MLLAESTRLLSLRFTVQTWDAQVLHGVDLWWDCYPMESSQRTDISILWWHYSLLPSFSKQAHNNALLLSRFWRTSVPITRQDAPAEYNYNCREHTARLMREKWMCDNTWEVHPVCIQNADRVMHFSVNSRRCLFPPPIGR